MAKMGALMSEKEFEEGTKDSVVGGHKPPQKLVNIEEK